MHEEHVITREDLHKAVWETPLTHLAKTYGVPSSFLTKLCEQCDIPRPGPDYWPCRKLGYAMEKTPLPAASVGTPASINLEWTPKKTAARSPAKPVGLVEISPTPTPPGAPEEKSGGENKTTVAEDFRRAHPLIRQGRELLAKGTPDNYGLIRAPWREACVNIAVTKDNVRRALLLMDAVLNAVDPSGKKSRITEEYGKKQTTVQFGSENVRLKITEQTKRYENKGKEGENKSHIWPRYLYESTGILTFYIDEFFAPEPKKWSDRKTCRIEDSLDEIVEAIEQAAEVLRLKKIEDAEAEKRRQEAERKYYALQRLREEEAARCRALEQQSELWERTDRLRAFIEACRHNLANQGALGANSPSNRWLDWAARHADAIDPLRGDYLKAAIKNLPQETVRVATDEEE